MTGSRSFVADTVDSNFSDHAPLHKATARLLGFIYSYKGIRSRSPDPDCPITRPPVNGPTKPHNIHLIWLIYAGQTITSGPRAMPTFHKAHKKLWYVLLMKIANSERPGSEWEKKNKPIDGQRLWLQNNLFIMCKHYTLFTTFFVSIESCCCCWLL